MRWSSRDGPCGSHHDEARLVKCESSVEETEEDVDSAAAGPGAVSCG